jgi:hypothetical protein
MLYDTSSSYSATTGADGSGSNNVAISITGRSDFTLSGISNSNSVYNGMLVFQDRSNTTGLTVSGTSAANVPGTFYAPNASLTISGGSTYTSQLIIGSLTESGGSSIVTISPPASQGNLVYLVE